MDQVRPAGGPPLDVDVLHQRLETLVDMVLSVRRSVRPPAEALASFDRARQERFLAAVETISRQTVELAFNFCQFGLPGLACLREQEWEGWLASLLEAYDDGGVIKAIVLMQQVEDYAQSVRRQRAGRVRFEEVLGVLAAFVQGLSGRHLKLAAGEVVYTDTETLFLPAELGHSEGRAGNFALYKAMAAHLWAQTWFGTWREPLSDALAAYPDRDRALRRLHALETLRLDAALGRELPGLAREMAALCPRTLPGPWCAARQRLAAAAADVGLSLALLEQVYELAEEPAPLCYQGTLLPERVEPVMQARAAADRRALQQGLTALAAERVRSGERPPGEAPVFTVDRVADPDRPQTVRLTLRLHDQAVAPHAELRAAMDSILQDLGDIPDEYLVPAGHGGYAPAAGSPRGEGAAAAAEECAYDEWDHLRRQYRKRWCLLHECEVHPVEDDFVARTRDKYRGLLKQLYRNFEALRGEDKLLKRQSDGDGVDIDAVVQSWADRRAGLEGDHRLFVQRRRVERDIAVMFLVDMSGSTKGWVNELEREALVLLCEALEVLGDRYAIYGFSGLTHRRCDLFRIKALEEPYGAAVRARISGIRPRDYTRMGVFIRHATRLLQQVEARTRLLITLSDGRPDDQDGYRGDYGVEDTRQALVEAKHQGIHPFCITIDETALEYLPRMYGPVNFTVINEVRRLPYKVSDIYRRLTM